MSDRSEQTVEELRDELRDRDLKVSGTKDELIERLDEDDEADDGVDDDDDGGGSSRSGSRLTDVVARIGRDFAEVTGLRVEGVTGLHRTDEDGWEAEVDAVEVARVPPSMDVLATYAVTAEPDGAVLGFERVRRFRRSEAGS